MKHRFSACEVPLLKQVISLTQRISSKGVRQAVVRSALAIAFFLVSAVWWDVFIGAGVSYAASPEESHLEASGNNKKLQGATSPTAEQISPASVNEELNKLEQEEALVEQALKHYYLADYYFQFPNFKNWQLQLAEVELEQAIRYVPDLKVAHQRLCLVSLLTANFLRATAEFMMVVGLGEPIPLNEVEKAELDKKALVLHYKRGLVYGKKSDWQHAAFELELALTYGLNDYVVHRSLAFTYANLHQFEKAEEHYLKTFALAPADAFCHADFAFMLYDQGTREKAQKQLEQAVKLSPQVCALHVDLGWLAEARGDWKTAVSEFRQATTLSPKHASLWLRLGKIFEKQGAIQETIDAYTKALDIDPTLSEVKEALVRLKQSSLDTIHTADMASISPKL